MRVKSLWVLFKRAEVVRATCPTGRRCGRAAGVKLAGEMRHKSGAILPTLIVRDFPPWRTSGPVSVLGRNTNHSQP